MKLFVGITDLDWFRLLSARPDLDEVNFWQPGGNHLFRALQPGQPFLFKLHAPRNFVVGGGTFAYATLLPVSLAWEVLRNRRPWALARHGRVSVPVTGTASQNAGSRYRCGAASATTVYRRWALPRRRRTE